MLCCKSAATQVWFLAWFFNRLHVSRVSSCRASTTIGSSGSLHGRPSAGLRHQSLGPRVRPLRSGLSHHGCAAGSPNSLLLLLLDSPGRLEHDSEHFSPHNPSHG